MEADWRLHEAFAGQTLSRVFVPVALEVIRARGAPFELVVAQEIGVSNQLEAAAVLVVRGWSFV